MALFKSEKSKLKVMLSFSQEKKFKDKNAN